MWPLTRCPCTFCNPFILLVNFTSCCSDLPHLSYFLLVRFQFWQSSLVISAGTVAVCVNYQRAVTEFCAGAARPQFGSRRYCELFARVLTSPLRLFQFSAPSVWNSLPQTVLISASLFFNLDFNFYLFTQAVTEHWSDLPPAPLKVRPYGAIEIQFLLLLFSDVISHSVEWAQSPNTRRNVAVVNDCTYIHKEYLYRAYYPNSKSLYALRSLNKKVFTVVWKLQMTVQAVVDLMEGHSRLVDRQPKNFYRQICCECVRRLTIGCR